jgi:molybdate transport system substrate-binding protein
MRKPRSIFIRPGFFFDTLNTLNNTATYAKNSDAGSRQDFGTVMNGLRVISSMAIKALLGELAWTTASSGLIVDIESVGGVDAARRVATGETFDVAVLASEAIDKLISAGHAVAVSKVDVVQSTVGVAVRSGASRPSLASEDDVKGAVLAAASVGYSTGPSGTALLALFDRWGIRRTMADRLVQTPPGVPVGSLIAQGSVSLGFQQMSELISYPGIDVIGPLPSPIQIVTTFSAALCSRSTSTSAAQDWLVFLVRPENDAVKRRHGMEPAG